MCGSLSAYSVPFNDNRGICLKGIWRVGEVGVGIILSCSVVFALQRVLNEDNHTSDTSNRRPRPMRINHLSLSEILARVVCL